MKKKTLALILALVMVFGAAVGGTIAYLTDKTEEVKNTFTVGKVDIDLTETKPVDKTAKMVPGNDIEKNPAAIVKANSEACYLFVKINESANLKTFISYAVADGWTAMTDVDGVFYREVAAGTADQSFDILKDNKVTVKSDVTSTTMATASENQPTLTFTAYACQKANLSLTEAWNAVK